jgi:hypothetical protein
MTMPGVIHQLQPMTQARRNDQHRTSTLSGTDANAWPTCDNTLGVALYRNGKSTEAVPVLEQSLAASRGKSDAFDLLFLAMSHHQLDPPAKAKKCCDRAVKRVNEKRDVSSNWAAELKAFHAEAERALKDGTSP